ncbi:hypothetical protein E8L90_16925 [Brevibacillus antibioticus]|uniref:Uncharacterized protein n=1 Tax=Brevibacillus antibioticus TaxID=2570228 RepID=A0A4U2YAP3_9BACL|nr:hypothetical protein [Brevibacillus antibioticus]TKI57012.1 hypothetical protein E8L90_16925 [Brevibacillus antibioticus]
MIKKGIALGLILSLTGLLPISSQATNVSNQPQQVSQDITADKVKQWIREQGKEKEYYLRNLTFQLSNVDNDSELEVIATIEGGAHLGHFFIFDKQSAEQYKLVTEQPWRVADSGFDESVPDIGVKEPVAEIDGKVLYQTIVADGGSGLSSRTAYLWYLENGKFTVAWNGEIRLTSTFQNNNVVEIGTYDIDEDNLFYFSNSYKINTEDKKAQPEIKQTAAIFKFNGQTFKRSTLFLP